MKSLEDRQYGAFEVFLRLKMGIGNSLNVVRDSSEKCSMKIPVCSNASSRTDQQYLQGSDQSDDLLSGDSRLSRE